MRRLYGYDLNLQPICEVNKGEAQVVQLIYQSYIDGLSLGGIAKLLKSKNISSSSGNDTWGRAAIDKLLSNDKYVPYIIAHDTFHAAQCEKQLRSNLDKSENVIKRKDTHYSSKQLIAILGL